MSRPIRLANGRTVGRAIGGIAVFNVGERHFFRAADGYTLDEQALEDARRDCKTIRFNEESGAAWTVPLAVFINCGTAVDYGYGRKIACAKKHYQRLGVPQQGQLFAGDQGGGDATH